MEKIKEYNVRFGQIAIEKGFLTIAQLKEALSEQIHDEIYSNKHRLIGSILFEKDLMTPQQIEVVLNELSTRRNDTK